MESGQLRKLNLCYAGIQSLYWAGFAAIWAFLSVLLLYRGFSNSQIGTVSALALLMPLAVQPVLASLADRDRRFTSRRLAMALTGLLLLCAVGLWCSAGSMVVTAALYVLVGISLTATAPFHSAMAMELQQHGVALNYGLSRGLGSACYAASVLVLGVVVEQRLAQMGVLNLYACIGWPETEDEYLTRNSAQFHEHLGFTLAGTFRRCGYKFGRWYDMVWMEKLLAPHRPQQPPIIPYPDLPHGENV